MLLPILRYLSILLPVLVLIRLGLQRLWLTSPYRELAGFLLIGVARDLVLLRPGYSTHSYTILWEGTLPILLLGQVFAGIGTYAAIASLYPKIGRFAVWLFTASLACACLAGLAVLPFETTRIGAAEAELRVLFLVQRWVATLLAGGLVLAVVFLARYPSPMKRLPRNLQVHSACIALYFASYAVLYALENTKALGGVEWAELTQLLLVVGVYAAWGVGLSRQGESSEPWPELDPTVADMIDARYYAAVDLFRQAAGEGRR